MAAAALLLLLLCVEAMLIVVVRAELRERERGVEAGIGMMMMTLASLIDQVLAGKRERRRRGSREDDQLVGEGWQLPSPFL